MNTENADGTDVVLKEVVQAVAWVTINRPQAMNALTPAMLEKLKADIGSLGSNAAVRVIVLTGAGKAFSAGLKRSGITNSF